MTNKEIQSIQGKLRYDQLLGVFKKTQKELQIPDILSVLYKNEKDYIRELAILQEQSKESGNYKYGWQNPQYHLLKGQLKKDFGAREYTEWFTDIDIPMKLRYVEKDSISTKKKIQDIMDNEDGEILKIDKGEWILINTSKVQFTRKDGGKIYYKWVFTGYKYFKNLIKEIDKYINIQDGNIQFASSDKKMGITGKKRNNKFSKTFNRNLKKEIEEKYFEYLI